MQNLSRILHVDDDDDIRTVVKMTLELVGGFQVSQFASGHEALERAQSLSPQLFLLDVMMPGMGGEETWARLSALPGLEDVPAMFVTAKAERQLTQDLLGLGALAVILKPFDPVNLCSIINQVWQDYQTKSEPRLETIAM